MGISCYGSIVSQSCKLTQIVNYCHTNDLLDKISNAVVCHGCNPMTLTDLSGKSVSSHVVAESARSFSEGSNMISTSTILA